MPSFRRVHKAGRRCCSDVDRQPVLVSDLIFVLAVYQPPENELVLEQQESMTAFAYSFLRIKKLVGHSPTLSRRARLCRAYFCRASFSKSPRKFGFRTGNALTRLTACLAPRSRLPKAERALG